MDVAHNPAAIKALCLRIRKEKGLIDRPIYCLYAASRDKDIGACLREVSNVTPSTNIFFCQTTYFRAIPVAELIQIFTDNVGKKCGNEHYQEHFESHTMVNDVLCGLLDMTLNNNSSEDSKEGTATPLLFIFGTMYMMPPARLELGINDERD